MKFETKYFSYLFILALLIFSVDVEAQCAMCKQAAESSLNSNPNSMVRSLNTGILYLMAVPYLMLCFIFRKQIKLLFRKVFPKKS
ncbi:MAG: hypothetical protein Q7W45_10445 [Bacteroidota bacterium]|nr:hypothetical protein [Bacteroidota bacterium]MDP3146332.1 hypothetical protein [Bacteroidota bacterium]MDP3556596.1 hypothetical protein [Bacteroidota bacterium]